MLSGSKRTTLNLDAELVNKAQDFGLNLSQWVNARLREFLNGSFTLHAQSKNDAQISNELIVRKSDGFRNWLVSNRNDKRYIRSLELYLTKYFTGLVLSSPQNIIEYTAKMKTTSKYLILTLRLYIKYLEETRFLSGEESWKIERANKDPTLLNSFYSTDFVIWSCPINDYKSRYDSVL